jgi:polysaccharide deacetylase family protein (PEP-CTERM system associated)
MNDLGVCCTMFVLGKFAESFPSVVRTIHAEGHEVASHGYGHTEVFHQSRQQFTKEVRRSKESLEQLIGAPVYGYRAPDFSIVRKTLWALDILAEVGFAYDSSIFPIKHPRYGIPDWPVAPRCLQLDNGRSIVEFPIATLPGHNRNWPIGGGGYFRLLPGVIARHAAKRVLSSMPFVLYCHPYEFDPREFREIPLRVPLKLRLHQGIGRRWFEGRFRAFVERFGGQRMIDLFWSTKWPTIRPESRPV